MEHNDSLSVNDKECREETGMKIILLSGGSGKRLWPLSNDVLSKQFLKILKTENGFISMLQRVYGQIMSIDEKADIIIATSKTQVASIHKQVGNEVGISVEPSRRDTFPAIVLACAYLNYVKNISEDEVVIVCPIDSYVDDTYFSALKDIEELAESGAGNLVLMGIVPTYPSEKYGYIIPCDTASVSKVKSFKEKPDAKTAEDYILNGGLWNGGVFAFRLKYILEKAHRLVEFNDYYELLDKYEELPKISFDYEIAEREENISVLRYSGEWRDLGTWNTLTEVMDDVNIGKVITNDTCNNVHVINELNMPILCMGLNDVVVSASPEGILVSDKEQSSYIKPYVDGIDQQIMFAEKSWGSYRVIDVEENSLTVKITLNAGHRMNYHSHDRRDEIWNVISGEGHTIVDGMRQPVEAGDVITIQSGCRHTIIADSELKLIEVQLGKEISVMDKHKFELEE